ncbi:MAG TPA: hydrogenase maturation nickel metallochaperone HypA [Candidatus Acidoferrales bacterium]|nr:hydrogenase maturation nickel metallochaperone HypA [Candidatus Acidoferrales bacterium]
MHELSIAGNILEIVNENTDGGSEVKSIKVKIGRLAGVIPDSLEFCFSAITKDTPLEKAKLEIENVEVVVHCNSCGAAFAVEDFFFQCQNCGSPDVKVISGNELQVVEVEINDGADKPT